MSTAALYYRHSGRCTAPALFATLAAGCLSALVLGPIYAIIVFYMPIVYVNVLLTIGLGALLGVIIRKVAMAQHIRSLAMILLIAAVTACVTIYASFVGWLLPVAGWSYFFFTPTDVLDVLDQVAEVGVWSLKGDTVKGTFLIIIWIGEAVTILGGTMYFAYEEIAKTPYCEHCSQWLPVKTMVGPFEKVADAKALRADLEQGNFAALGAIKPLAPDAAATEFSDYELTDCPTCPDMAVVSIRNVLLVADKEGKITPKINVIVNRLLIDHDSCELIKQLGPQPEAAAAVEPVDGEEKAPTEQ